MAAPTFAPEQVERYTLLPCHHRHCAGHCRWCGLELLGGDPRERKGLCLHHCAKWAYRMDREITFAAWEAEHKRGGIYVQGGP